MFLRNSYFAAAPYAAIDACVRCAGTWRVVGIKFVVLVPLQELRVFILSHCNLLQWRESTLSRGLLQSGMKADGRRRRRNQPARTKIDCYRRSDRWA
jgi:hypothetical protein